MRRVSVRFFELFKAGMSLEQMGSNTSQAPPRVGSNLCEKKKKIQGRRQGWTY
jgi:hypothetical protein